MTPLETLRYHVTGAIERGEAVAVTLEAAPYSLRDLKRDLRAGDCAWPGGYPRYFLAADGEALSFAAVRERFKTVVCDMLGYSGMRDFRIVACPIHWEGAPLICAHTGAAIPSAYGEPDSEEA